MLIIYPKLLGDGQLKTLPPELYNEIIPYLLPLTISKIGSTLTNVALVSKYMNNCYQHALYQIPAIKNLFNHQFPQNLSKWLILETYKKAIIQPYLQGNPISNKEILELLGDLCIPIDKLAANLKSIKHHINDNNITKSKALIQLSGNNNYLTKEQLKIISAFDEHKIDSLSQFCDTKAGAEFLAKNLDTIQGYDNGKIYSLSLFFVTEAGAEFLSNNFKTIQGCDEHKIRCLSQFCDTKAGAEFLTEYFDTIQGYDKEKIYSLSQFCATEAWAEFLTKNFNKIQGYDEYKIRSLSRFCATEAGAEFLTNNFDTIQGYSNPEIHSISQSLSLP